MNLKEEARTARKAVLDMIYLAQKSHIGSNLSCIELLTALFNKANITKDLGENEDRIIVGKGWAAASFYYFLAKKGIIDEKDLERFCKEGEENYIGLLEPSVCGVHCATGSIGMGLPFGVGMAFAKKINKQNGRIYVIEGDGGMQCGMTWESIQIAAQHKLDNLMLIIDQNNIQAMGDCKDILDNKNFENRLRSFGWVAETINGHDFEQIEKVLRIDARYRPVAIIANTVKGRGISFMENNVKYHYCPPTTEEYDKATIELNQCLN
jgi:transketolase